MPDTSAVYRPRKPQDSEYYQCVEDHFEEFERIYDDRFPKKYGFLRPYVKQVIYRYLDCGILHNGFARVKCEACNYEYLLAFSCKRRHFCLSCHQKRVVEFGEWLRSLPMVAYLRRSPQGRSAPTFRLQHTQNPAAVFPL